MSFCQGKSCKKIDAETSVGLSYSEQATKEISKVTREILFLSQKSQAFTHINRWKQSFKSNFLLLEKYKNL